MRSAALLLPLLLAAPHARAESPEEKGLAIAQEVDRRDTGWVDSQAELLMTLRNKHGHTSTRRLRSRMLEQENDGDKSLIIFDEPKDIDGTALLTFSHATDPDDQWLYLPALKRIKRIASTNKSGPFVGSEFAYEDLSSQEVEKYSYRFLREESRAGMNCFVVERYPVDKRSGYTRQIVWIDKAEYRIQVVEYYDRKDMLLKTLVLEGYEKYLDAYWRAERFTMSNHQSGKSTELIFNNYAFRNGFADRDFDRSTLDRVR
jgi:outer membrane lipoprotein-sorting protein